MQQNKRDFSVIKRRILQYLELKGITKYAFYRDTGTTNGVLSQPNGISEENLLRFLSYYNDVNPIWLLTGEGEILLTKTPKFRDNINAPKVVPQNVPIRKLQNLGTNPESPKGEETFEENVADVTVDKVFKLRTDRLIDRQQIPIYDMEAVAGLVPLFADQYSQSIVEVMETTLIPKCDGGLRIVGDSMYPLLKSGDIVFYKQVHDIMHSIIWGEMYLISFDIDGDEYVSVKYLQKSDTPDHIVLVSYNEHHKPMEIHINRIRALAFIKASLRLNSLK